MYFNIKNRFYIHKIFLLFPIIILTGQSVKLYFLTLLCAFIHESAHFFAAVFTGEKVTGLFLTPYGFELNILPPEKKHEYIILFSGPSVSLFLSIFFIICGCKKIAEINFLLFLINFLPALPLDGGRILKVFLWDSMGCGRGCDILKKISLICAAFIFILSAVKLNIWLFFIAILILSRSRQLYFSPFYKKRGKKIPLNFYYFDSGKKIHSVFRLISPYNYIAIITPDNPKVIFEWEILKKAEKKGIYIPLSDFNRSH